MTLQQAMEQYIAWRQAHGASFKSVGAILRMFVRHVGAEIDCDAVTSAQVCTFLAGNRPLTHYRVAKHSALSVFYRYAISRGYATHSPLPGNEPRTPVRLPPHIYSDDELHRLFGAIERSRTRATQVDAHTLRTLLLLLYGAGLRRGEALGLTVSDVDLSDALLTVRNTKFFKSRLVPIGRQLVHALRSYSTHRLKRPLREGDDSAFLASPEGTKLKERTVQCAFAKLLHDAGIPRANDSRQAPCLHSFRHSFAVNRLTSWYRQGADVQRLLPALSTYMGHKNLAGTQVYLSMTPELLHQASLRFERYARGANDE